MLSAYQGHYCQHRSDDFPDIAAILRPHQPRVVVELGTDNGGFAAFLADLVKPWGGKVHTFDIEAKFQPELLRAFPNLFFVRADVLGAGPVGPAARCPLVAALISQPSALLYCDNGNKIRELELYAPLLQVGSILGVHDYNSKEISGEWVEPFVAALGYEPEGHARMEALRNEWYPEPMTRFWVRRQVIAPPEPEPIAEERQAEAPQVAAEAAPPPPTLPVDLTDEEDDWFADEKPARRRWWQFGGGR